MLEYALTILTFRSSAIYQHFDSNVGMGKYIPEKKNHPSRSEQNKWLAQTSMLFQGFIYTLVLIIFSET